MPSNKPRIQALIDQEIYEKFKDECKRTLRTESNLGGLIITNYYTEKENKIDYKALYEELEMELTIVFDRLEKAQSKEPTKQYNITQFQKTLENIEMLLNKNAEIIEEDIF